MSEVKNLKSELRIKEEITTIGEDTEILVVYLTCLGNYFDIKNESTYS